MKISSIVSMSSISFYRRCETAWKISGPLTNHFVAKYAEERPEEQPISRIEKGAERLFYDYSWPGNVRELENVIERAMVMCAGDVITVDDLPTDFKKNVNKNSKLSISDLSPQSHPL